VTPEKTLNQWDKIANKEKAAPKWPPKGKMLIVLPIDPVETMADGKFGKQKAYILETREIGSIYVNPQTLIRIVEMFKGDYSSGITVQF
jgi:hypothetical protein